MTWLEWLKDASPWLQGLLSGAGAILLWEGWIKPVRERRSLAHALAEEVGFNLQLAGMMREILVSRPNEIPIDLSFITLVFDATASRLGELPTSIVGKTVLYYAGIKDLNRQPALLTQHFDDWKNPKGEGRLRVHRAEESKALFERQFLILRGGLETAIDRANDLLPRLRRAAVPWWRLDYLFRRKKIARPEELRTRIEIGEERRVALRPKTPG